MRGPLYKRVSIWTGVSLITALSLISGCSSSGAGERTPTPARVGPPPSVEVIPGAWSTNPNLMVPRQATDLPRHLGLDPSERRLDGGHVNARGPVRALVLPLSFGTTEPSWTSEEIGYHLIGAFRADPDSLPMAVAPRLYAESQGLLRLDGSVFPPVIHPENAPAGVLHHPTIVREMVYRTIRHWASRVNLASFDSDGPDGIPMSGDDDGLLDLVIVPFETDEESGVVHLPSDLEVPVGKEGELVLGLGRVLALGIPRTRDRDQRDLSSTTLVLAAMGLSQEEMYYPSGYPRTLSTLARMRLGWTKGAWASVSGVYTIRDSSVLAVPVMDVPDGRAFWLIERAGDHALVMRVARKRDGGFGVVSRNKLDLGDPDGMLPLTQTEGTLGPRVRLTWEGTSLRAHVALTHRAALEDEPDGDAPDL